MQAKNVLGHFFGKGKMSTIEVSQKMGKSRSFLSNYLSTGKVPSLELTADIMDAIDNDVLIRNRSTGEEIPIDPPKRE